MAVSFMKLWHLLLDRGLKKVDLERMSGISHYTTKRMTRNQNITTDDLGRICLALSCKVEDIVDFIPDDTFTAGSHERN